MEDEFLFLGDTTLKPTPPAKSSIPATTPSRCSPTRCAAGATAPVRPPVETRFFCSEGMTATLPSPAAKCSVPEPTRSECWSVRCPSSAGVPARSPWETGFLCLVGTTAARPTPVAKCLNPAAKPSRFFPGRCAPLGSVPVAPPIMTAEFSCMGGADSSRFESLREGFFDRCTYLSNCEVFDPISKAFTMLPRPMLSKRWGACAVAHRGRIFVLGGKTAASDESILSSCEEFDPSSKTFTMLPRAMCNSRWDACAVALDGRVFVFGGRIREVDLCNFWHRTSGSPRCEVFTPPPGSGTSSEVASELSVSVGSVEELRSDNDRLRTELSSANTVVSRLREQITTLQTSLFDPLAPYSWNIARFPPFGMGPRPSFLMQSPDCPADVKKLVEELMASRGSYRSGLVGRPVAGFQVHRIDIVDRSAATLQALQARLGLLDNLRSTKTREVMQAETAVSEDTEMLRIVGELKGMFVTHNRQSNVLLTFHGTGVDGLEHILCAGLQKFCRQDEGYFGYGCYTTPSLEYAAMYASGELGEIGPRPKNAEGCWPVILFAAAVGLAYPVTRARAYADPRDMYGFSKFFGKPLFNGAVDTHVAGVATRYAFQVAPVEEVEYLEIVSAETHALHPLAVLWVRK
eukprot:RCo016651